VKKTATTSTVLLKHHLKALRLPTVLAECEKVAQRCAADNVDHLGFLLQLIELELLDREQRAAERRLKAARFPTVKTLEDFDFAAQPSLNKVLVAELMRCEFVDRREAVILIGNPGTGKTHVATALAGEACRRGKKVRFWRDPPTWVWACIRFRFSPLHRADAPGDAMAPRRKVAPPPSSPPDRSGSGGDEGREMTGMPRP